MLMLLYPKTPWLIKRNRHTAFCISKGRWESRATDIFKSFPVAITGYKDDSEEKVMLWSSDQTPFYDWMQLQLGMEQRIYMIQGISNAT